ncbi:MULTISPECIES: hypothetical protein [Streptomyces]|uniref:Secreted protein n=1 Tax=Streptomyces griseosporeus TaxID=1910 RepID=A0ABV3L0M9_STRGS|nr:hypothetical protein [Streptomyces actuosus]MBM4824049.1 hypothetical protein [Streptomyces actuosus]
MADSSALVNVEATMAASSVSLLILATAVRARRSRSSSLPSASRSISYFGVEGVGLGDLRGVRLQRFHPPLDAVKARRDER